MKKHKLPKDWIVVNSTSYPDRVYYFNVKTNTKSWTAPGFDEEVPINMEPLAKRKKCSNQKLSESVSLVSGSDGVKNTESASSQKHGVKRNVQCVTASETPQMQALRKSMAQRKTKGRSSTDNSSSKDLIEAVVHSKVTNEATDNAEVSPIKNKIIEKHATLTPQMRVILEKIQQKKSSTKIRKNQVQNNILLKDTIASEKKVLRPRRRTQANTCLNVGDSRCQMSVPVAHKNHEDGEAIPVNVTTNTLGTLRANKITSSIRKPPSNNSDSSHSDKFLGKLRASTKTLGRKGLKKNLAKDRMEKLKRNLNIDNKDIDTVINEQCSLHGIDNTGPPTIYKNAAVRLERLHNRLSTVKATAAKNAKVSETDYARISSSKSDPAALISEIPSGSTESEKCEEMDWEPLEDERIMFEIQAVRTHLYGDITEKRNNVPENTLDAPLLSGHQGTKALYIVIDTNVLLSNIPAVEEIRDATFKNYGRPILVIPWTVIRELDYIKDNKSAKRTQMLCLKARTAVRFLNDHFSAKHPRVVGQTPEDVSKNKEKFACNCPDDEILQTCLQIQELGKSVILLSYDKNLCNKAMIFDITTLGRNDPFEKIDYLDLDCAKPESLWQYYIQSPGKFNSASVLPVDEELQIVEDIFENLKKVMTHFLTKIVEKELQNLYGNQWERHASVKPPWTVTSLFKCALKHWIAATSEAFIRQAEPVIKDLHQIFSHITSCRRLKQINGIIEKCHDLVQMAHVDKYSDAVKEAACGIEVLKTTYRQHEHRLNLKQIQEGIGTEHNIDDQECRADKAFKHFEAIYSYAREMGGLAAELVGMPCSFFYKRSNTNHNALYIKQIQPEVAANVHQLLQNLSTALEQSGSGNLSKHTVEALYHGLTTFLPEESTTFPTDLAPLDVYCCLLRKECSLKAGLKQLQELSIHFCRLATYRCT